MSKKQDKNEPMDPGAAERATPLVHANNARPCWAVKTLVAEVSELFPEVNYEYADRDGRNTALGVIFDVSMLEADEVYDFITLVNLMGDPAHNDDARIESVVASGTDQSAHVTFRSNPRTQDSREPFGLGDALVILAGDE